MLDEGKLRGVTSELTLAEVMVKPLASRNAEFIMAYQQLLSHGSKLDVVPVSRAVLEQSARMRAAIGGNLADAIHVATAVLGRCSHFISENAGIRAPAALNLVRTSEVPGLLASTQGTA